MADQFLQTLDPRYQAEYEDAQRRQQMAQAMMQMSMKGPMVPQAAGGITPKMHPMQAILSAVQGIMAAKGMEGAQKSMHDVMGKSQAEGAQGVQDFMKAVSPAPGLPAQPEQQRAAPIGSRDMPNPENNSNIPAQEATPPVQPDINAAITKFLPNSNPMVRATVQEYMKRRDERIQKAIGTTGAVDASRAEQIASTGNIPTTPMTPPAAPFGEQMKDADGKLLLDANGKPVIGINNPASHGQRHVTPLPAGASATATLNSSPEFKEIVGARDKELQTKKEAARAAQDALSANRFAVQALEEGAKAGGGEGWKQAVRKLGQAFNLPSAETAPTEQLAMGLGKTVLDNARKLAPVTKEDISFLEKQLGSINTDPQALTRMMAYTNAIATKELHDYNDYLKDFKATVGTTQTPVLRDQLQAMLAGQGIGYEAPSQLFGSQAFQMDTARNMINRGFDPAKLQGLDPEFLADLKKNPNLSINATGGFPGLPKGTGPQPSGGNKMTPEQIKARIKQLEQELMGK